MKKSCTAEIFMSVGIDRTVPEYVAGVFLARSDGHTGRHFLSGTTSQKAKTEQSFLLWILQYADKKGEEWNCTFTVYLPENLSSKKLAEGTVAPSSESAKQFVERAKGLLRHVHFATLHTNDKSVLDGIIKEHISVKQQKKGAKT